MRPFLRRRTGELQTFDQWLSGGLINGAAEISRGWRLPICSVDRTAGAFDPSIESCIPPTAEMLQKRHPEPLDGCRSIKDRDDAVPL